MFQLFGGRNYRYSLLKGHSGSITSLPSKCSSVTLFVALLALLCVAGTGFVGGRLSVKGQNHFTIPLATKFEVFHYNERFGSAPSNLTDQAWVSLFPEQGGFFKHPTIAPQRSAFSVFHQLHCLNGIREGYWAVYDAALSGQRLSEEDLSPMLSPSHIRHCIDLIRQSLMCQPDTTVEVKDKVLGGVTGFGTEHKCRDWEQLFRWTAKWQAYQQDPREEVGVPGRGSHLHHGHIH